MTALAWDQTGERRFESGIDRGVLYLSDGRAVAWNGLVGIEDSTDRESTSFYIDGVKFLERQIPNDFAATLRAFTYPDEFNEVNGVAKVQAGLYYHGQSPDSFGLCYRTRIGNEIEGSEHGYRLHLLYNVMAVPSGSSFSSLGEGVSPSEFAWTLTSTPPSPIGYRPTAHISVDSTDTDPARLAAIEELLYGNDVNDPWLPDPDTFAELFQYYNSLIIADNGDGTWTATDLTDSYISMIDPTTFEIVGADATFIDANTYDISTTIP